MTGALPASPEVSVSCGKDPCDVYLLTAFTGLLSLGLVMVASASVTAAEKEGYGPFYFLWRQTLSVGLGLCVAYVALRTPTRVLRKLSTFALFLAIALLAAVLVPGLGVESHGAMRWLSVGPVSFQPSEFAKVLAILYLAGFIDRHPDSVRATTSGLLCPIAVLTILGVLLYVEPDTGAMVVLIATILGMLFLAGVSMARFLAVGVLASAALTVLVLMRPHSMARITNFMDPLANPLGGGFQLTQALIAFGRGEWLGVGLGGSVQKLFYLPEAHTDFIFAVIAEELGLLGTLLCIATYTAIVWRAFVIGAAAEGAGQRFSAYLAYGLGLLIGLEGFIHMGVNMGALPTKGLTLPLVSYGSNSMIATSLCFGVLFRIDREMRFPARSRSRYGP
ncbi:MAG: putative lipid II flippase FtsW [Beggiatoa sp.]|nr:putative lipid II flippase FtsW [Beggiatoa sp.]